jgi:hypothetical protein
MLVGAAAGLAFVAFAIGVIALALITARLGAGWNRLASRDVRLGPEPVRSFLLSVAWGVPGGALGGLMHERSRRPTPAHAGTGGGVSRGRFWLSPRRWWRRRRSPAAGSPPRRTP